MLISVPVEVRLIEGSSEVASKLAPDLVGKISLIVTSPPYHNAISYNSHVEDPSANYRTRENLNYASEYLSLLERVWHQAYLMLKPGGYIAVNVGTVLDAGYQYPLPQDIQTQLDEAGWEFVRNFVWNKVTAGVKRAGSVIQHALPGYWYPNIMTEHIILYRKPGPEVPLNQNVPDHWWENVWDLAPVPPRTINHPAPFPEDLPHRLIRMVTQPGEYVMDPFNGAGATTKAAFDLDRPAIGFDISKTYIEIAERRLKSRSSVRPRQLRVIPVKNKDFKPGKSRGETRHGAGLNARKRKVS